MKAPNFVHYLWPKNINFRYALNLRANIASISFITCSIPFFVAEQFITGIALSLGSIACGLADTASVTKHRRVDYLISLLLFFTNTLLVNLLFPDTLLFTIYLGFSSFLLFMLAIYSPRLGAIGFATILSGIYAMLLHSPNLSVWFIPIALTIGAIWYIMWQWIIGKLLPHQEDKDILYEIFQLLSEKLKAHARPLLTPTKHVSDNFINAAKMRSQLSTKYNELQNRLHQQMSAGENSPQLSLILPAMQVAEEIAAQTRLMHFSPSTDFRSNNLSILREINQTVVLLCHSLKTIKHAKPTQLPEINFADLRCKLDKREIKNNKYHKELALAKAFIDKLEIIFIALQNLANNKNTEQTIQNSSFATLSNNQVKPKEEPKLKLKDKFNLQWQKFISQFTLESNSYRHALRGTLCLTVGFVLVRLFELEFGFWTLMTSLLVLKPNLSMTWARLLHRIAGTLAGLAVVVLMLRWQVPSFVLPFIFCVGAILFFHTTARQYGFSVFCVTLFVFSGFALNGQGNEILIPRLENTLLGVLLPVLFVLFIAPGWQKASFPHQLLNTVRGYLSYLLTLKQFFENTAVVKDVDAKDKDASSAEQTLLPCFKRCIRDDTNLFDHWLGYLSEPKQKNAVSEAILLCCHSSNIMLRLLTQLNGLINQINSENFLPELDKTIAIFTQLENRLIPFSQSPNFFNFLSEHKNDISPKLNELELQGDTKDPCSILCQLRSEVHSLIL